jgi:hypothetical protein
MFPAVLFPTSLFPTSLFPGAGKSTSTTPSLTLSPSTAVAVDGSSTISLTGTLAGVSGTLAATVTGGGTLSTATPTSGVAFTYTPPAIGSGVATVTLSAVGVIGLTNPTPQTCTITYGPNMTYTFRDAFAVGSGTAGLALVAQLADDTGTDVGSPLSGTFADFGGGAYSFACPLAITAAGQIRYYVSGTPGTNLALSTVTPLRDSPGVTTTVAAILAAQCVGIVVTVNSPTSLTCSGITIPVGNLNNLGCVLNDGITGAFKAGSLMGPASVSGSNVLLTLLTPGFATVAVGDQVEIRF